MPSEFSKGAARACEREGEAGHLAQQFAQYYCPEFKEAVRDGVVFLRASCERALCVKWRSGQCRMCAVGREEQLDLLEGRS